MPLRLSLRPQLRLLACLSLLAACERDPIPTQATVPPATALAELPSPELEARVFFAESLLEVAEAETQDVDIRYEVRNLAAEWSIPLIVLPGTASQDDITLTPNTIVIPAGTGVLGQTSVELTAVQDRWIAEGSETARVRFATDPERSIHADLGDDLEVVIQEAGAAPCPGVRALALPVTIVPDQNQFATTVTLDHLARAAGTRLDLIGPHVARRSWDREELEQYQNALLMMQITAWRVETTSDRVRHELDVRWPDGTVLGQPEFRFGFSGGACSEEILASCVAEGCELIP